MLFDDGSRTAIDLMDVKFEILDKVGAGFDCSSIDLGCLGLLRDKVGAGFDPCSIDLGCLGLLRDKVGAGFDPCSIDLGCLGLLWNKVGACLPDHPAWRHCIITPAGGCCQAGSYARSAAGEADGGG